MRVYLDGRKMDDVAIARIQQFAAEAEAMNPAGYWVANSYGKDSTVIRDLFLRSGCKGQLHHNLTGIDPPELIWFGRKHHPETIVHKMERTMWEMISREKIPPLRTKRYCCEQLKERGGDGLLVIDGIRWQESSRRRKRQMTEACFRSKMGKRYLHPIIDWSTADVWGYIRERELPYCSVYDEGQSRIGCVLCPMVKNPEAVAWQVARWPRIARKFQKAIEANCSPGTWDWWLNHRNESRNEDTSPVLFEDNPEIADAESGAGDAITTEPKEGAGKDEAK